MKKVLIISYRFPPLNHISSKRFGTMCKYFKNNGYESYVVTVSDSQYLGAKHDLSIPIPENNIFRIDSKSEHQGMQEKCLNILLELFNKFRFSSRVLGVGELQWYINVKKNIDLRKLKDIDIIIGTYGPMSNLYIAKYLSKKLGCPYIIDMRDFISDWKVVPSGYKRSYKVDRAIEKKIVFSADGIAVVSPGMKTILQERYPKKRIISIFNGWDEFPAKDVESVQEKYLYFAGTLYEHILAGIFLLLKALKKVNEKEKIKLIIRSLGPNNLNRKIKEIVPKMGLEGIVSVLPSATEEKVREERSKAYINVVLSSLEETRQEMLAILPGKTYEYICDRPPVLGIAPKKSDLAWLLSYTEKGVASSSIDEIVDFILHASNKYKGNDNVKKFSREFQAARLCGFMNAIIRSK